MDSLLILVLLFPFWLIGAVAMTTAIPTKPLIKACAYIRMSSPDSKDSPAMQKQAVLDLAATHGYQIVKWYYDLGITASHDPEKRAGWMRLLHDAPTAEWKVVLVYSRSRFSRLDSIEEGSPKQILREAGKTLHAVIEGISDWKSSTGRIMDTIRTEENHESSRKLGFVIAAAKKKALEDGTPFGAPCPYGYMRRITDLHHEERDIARSERFELPKGWSQVLIPGDGVEVETVQWLFSEYASRDVSFRSLAIYLNDIKHVPAPRSGRWKSRTVARILRNESYVGDTRLGKEQWGRFARLEKGQVVEAEPGVGKRTCEGVLRRSTHEGIIEREMWDRVQAKLKRRGNGRKGRRPRAGGHALTGIVICGHCGQTMSAHRREKRDTVYECRNAGSYGNGSGCGHWSVKELDLRVLLIDKLTEELDMRLLEPYSVQPPRPQQKRNDNADLKKLAQLEHQIKQGRKNVLLARREVIEGLQKELHEWEVEFEVLAERIKRKSEAVPQLEKELREWSKWFAAEKEKLIPVQKSPARGVACEEGLRFGVEEFRETLLRFGCKAICWWKDQDAGGDWPIDRVRILLGWRPQGVIQADSRENDCPQMSRGGPSTAHLGETWDAVLRLDFDAHDVFPLSYELILPTMKELLAKNARCGQIAEHLNLKGMKTREGNLWDTEKVMKFLYRNGVRGLRK